MTSSSESDPPEDLCHVCGHLARVHLSMRLHYGRDEDGFGCTEADCVCVRAEERAARAAIEAAAQKVVDGAMVSVASSPAARWCRQCWARWDSVHADDCDVGALVRALAGASTPAPACTRHHIVLHGVRVHVREDRLLEHCPAPPAESVTPGAAE